MKLAFCAACGFAETLQHHHLVTRSEGGGDEPSNLITLCYECHSKLHERKSNGRYRHSAQIKAGRERAKLNGVVFGRPHKLDAFQKREALKRLGAGESQSLVARTYGVDRATIGRLLQRDV